MSKVLFIAGPPRSGKSTLVRAFLESLRLPPVWARGFGDELFVRMCALYNVGLGAIQDDGKDLPHPRLFGQTPRRIMIALGQLLRALHGPQILGELILQTYDSYVHRPVPGELVVIHGAGYDAEVQVIAKRFGAENCGAILLSRQGCEWTDGRSRVNFEALGIEVAPLANDGTPEDLAEAGFNALRLLRIFS